MRLAAKLTGWHIDIQGVKGKSLAEEEPTDEGKDEFAVEAEEIDKKIGVDSPVVDDVPVENTSEAVPGENLENPEGISPEDKADEERPKTKDAE